MDKLLGSVLAAVALAVSAAAADAADWPSKPVRIVSPFAPGGTSDTLGRLLAQELSEKFGQQFFVENKGGAGGLIGSAAVASAEPDGTTFVISSVGTHVTSPATSASRSGTVSIATYFHTDAQLLAEIGTGYLLGRATGQQFRNGFFDQAAQLWSESGVLLATSNQIVYFKE